jgi:hypothetical protein
MAKVILLGEFILLFAVKLMIKVLPTDRQVVALTMPLLRLAEQVAADMSICESNIIDTEG